jgi:DNA repair exonuclease SbcCD ATPase subunit
MFKKVLVAGLAVAVGVAVLAVVSPTLFSAVWYYCGQGVKNAEDSVPLETRLEVLKQRIDALKKNEQKYYDAAAHQWKELEHQRKEVRDLAGNLDKVWNEEILPLKADLDDTKKTSLFGRDKIPTRASAEAELSRRYKKYEDVKQEFENKKEVLASAEEAQTETEKNLATLTDQRKEMESKLKQLAARLNKVKAKEARSTVPGSDNDYAALNAEIQDLSDKMDVREKSQEYRERYAGKSAAESSASAPAAAPVEKTEFKDTMKKIDEENARRNGGNVADQK